MEVNMRGDRAEEVGSLSSPISTISSFQMDFEGIAVNNIEREADRGTYSRESDDKQNGTRKQFAFLHESFKNPKPSTSNARIILKYDFSLAKDDKGVKEGPSLISSFQVSPFSGK